MIVWDNWKWERGDWRGKRGTTRQQDSCSEAKSNIWDNKFRLVQGQNWSLFYDFLNTDKFMMMSNVFIFIISKWRVGTCLVLSVCLPASLLSSQFVIFVGPFSCSDDAESKHSRWVSEWVSRKQNNDQSFSQLTICFTYLSSCSSFCSQLVYARQ